MRFEEDIETNDENAKANEYEDGATDHKGIGTPVTPTAKHILDLFPIGRFLAGGRRWAGEALADPTMRRLVSDVR